MREVEESKYSGGFIMVGYEEPAFGLLPFQTNYIRSYEKGMAIAKRQGNEDNSA